MKILKIQQKLSEKGVSIFTPLEFRRLTGLSSIASQRILERYTQRGLFCRLKKGLYALTLTKSSSWVIANRLIKPSYISYESALSYYGIIPETVYSITSATTKKPKEIEVKGESFVYHSLKRNVFTGYAPLEMNGQTILVAEPEKALCDYLYLVFLKKKKLNERLNIRKISLVKLIKYANLFKPKVFTRWVSTLSSTRRVKKC